jgi:hypothetical protein
LAWSNSTTWRQSSGTGRWRLCQINIAFSKQRRSCSHFPWHVIITARQYLRLVACAFSPHRKRARFVPHIHISTRLHSFKIRYALIGEGEGGKFLMRRHSVKSLIASARYDSKLCEGSNKFAWNKRYFWAGGKLA